MSSKLWSWPVGSHPTCQSIFIGPLERDSKTQPKLGPGFTLSPQYQRRGADTSSQCGHHSADCTSLTSAIPTAALPQLCTWGKTDATLNASCIPLLILASTLATQKYMRLQMPMTHFHFCAALPAPSAATTLLSPLSLPWNPGLDGLIVRHSDSHK